MRREAIHMDLIELSLFRDQNDTFGPTKLEAHETEQDELGPQLLFKKTNTTYMCVCVYIYIYAHIILKQYFPPNPLIGPR